MQIVKKRNAEEKGKLVLTIVMSIISLAWVFPVVMVAINSFKKTDYVRGDTTFNLPSGDMFAGFDNYTKGMTFGNYPFYKSVLFSVVITVLSVALILICTTMAAWYIARVNSIVCKIIYFTCIFSMVVPFQMVMFTLSKTAIGHLAP